MPVFTYKAIDGKGRQRRGTVDADTARDAREKLRRQEIRVTEMAHVEASSRDEKGKKGLRFRRPVRVRDLATFTRQFSTLLRSGVHLAEGLGVLVEQVGDRRFEVVLRDVRERIVGGANLADSLSYHPFFFSDLYINMVRAGEASGNLDAVLVRLADYLQSQATLRGKVVAALTYPAIMLTLGVSVVIFLMTYVVPQITSVLLKRGGVLPAPTEFLIQTTAFLRGYWWALAGAIVFAIINLRLFIATEKGRLWFDTALLKVPLVGPLFKKQALARFSITLSTLIKSGLPVHESLNIVAKVVNNSLLKRVISQIHDRILEGADISTPIRNSKIFPPMVGYMVSVGEQSGQLEEILDRIAATYEEEVDLAIQKMISLMEPLIIVLLAVVVGFIMLAVLLPLLQFNKL